MFVNVICLGTFPVALLVAMDKGNRTPGDTGSRESVRESGVYPCTRLPPTNIGHGGVEGRTFHLSPFKGV